MELKQIWEEALKIIKEETSPVSYETWIEPVIPCGIDGNQIILQVENNFFKEMLEKRYLTFIRNAIKFVTKNEYDIVLLTEEEQKTGLQKIDLSSEKKKSMADRNLNPKYVFDSFVVGNSNRMAHAASLAVAEQPAHAYNPLYLYGNSGLGKTHLMHSIGHFVLDKTPDAKVLYVTSETFTNELINSIQNNKMEEFRNKYRKIDLLMIDDIQFIAKKESTQEEFFHTFNALYENSKQIVISSDRPPKELKPLEERLISRFEWGLTVDVQSPDYETRIAILRKKAERDHITVPDDVMAYIAKNIASNIRELEGALTRIVAFAKLTNQDISIALAENSL
ncbi:MAG: chromosomal replication initiator protein DnaA, partial [Anaerotignum sp.]|nr:chromosomal replication initiator protein DnaA [Anaerotignum sp.]